MDTARLEHWVTSTRDLAWRAVEADRELAANDKEVAVENVRDQARVEEQEVLGMIKAYRSCVMESRDWERHFQRVTPD